MCNGAGDPIPMIVSESPVEFGVEGGSHYVSTCGDTVCTHTAALLGPYRRIVLKLSASLPWMFVNSSRWLPRSLTVVAELITSLVGGY